MLTYLRRMWALRNQPPAELTGLRTVHETRELARFSVLALGALQDGLPRPDSTEEQEAYPLRPFIPSRSN